MKKFLLVLVLLSMTVMGCKTLGSTTRGQPSSVDTNQPQEAGLNKNLDENDQAQLSKRLESLPLGDSDFWQNSDTSATYSVTPMKNFSSHDFSYCREFRLVETMHDERQLIEGSACRQTDGMWKVETSRDVS